MPSTWLRVPGSSYCSSGSEAARCPAPGLEFRVLLTVLLVPRRHGAQHLASSSGFFLLILLVPRRHGAQHLASSSGSFLLFRGGTVPGTWPRVLWARCGVYSRVRLYSSYGLDWCLPVRVRFGVQVTPALDTGNTVPSRVKLGLADSDSERNI